MTGVSVSCQGLGYFKPRKFGDVARMRSLVQQEDEQSMLVHAHDLEVQHDWAVVGEFCIPPKLLWKAFMYEWSPAILKFYANAVQGTLPDPTNLAKWSIDASGTCHLCSAAQATSRHILVGCPRALDEGRYTWRHNRVLGILREAMSLSIAKAKRNRNLQPIQQMVFVRPGQKMTSTRASASIIEAAVIGSSVWMQETYHTNSRLF
uniref:Reverse transcriptase zinc-binding domain-containing protein n=1 Tax=Cuerna arida TaxID=1464854 RepID=A0A1B6GXJ0_9HEMI